MPCRGLAPVSFTSRAAPSCATNPSSPDATIKQARPFPQVSGRAGDDSLTMLRVLSTHLFLNQRLHPGLLELAGRSGAEAVEIFAARQHFDYTSREHVRELADWFRSNSLQAFSLHAPLWPDYEMGRAGAPAVNVIHPEKSRRIDAMDEIEASAGDGRPPALPPDGRPFGRALR